MLVCQCKWLTYKQLCDIVASGADSLEAVQGKCGAGTECGGCVNVLQQLLAGVQPDSSHPQNACITSHASHDSDAA